MAVTKIETNDLVDRMFERIEESFSTTVENALQNALVSSEGKYDLQKAFEDTAKTQAMVDIFKHNGYRNLEDMTFTEGHDSRIKLEDLLTSEHFSMLFPKVITRLVVEASEPELNLTRLLQVVPWQGLVYRLPVFSGFGGNFDMAEADEPRKLEITGGKWQDVTIGKAGVQVQITEEAMKYNEYNVLNMYISAAGKALARWKEYKVAKMLQETASVAITNEGGTNTTGIGISGSTNGTLAYADIVKAIVYLYNKGFQNVDTIIMNPLAFPVFMENRTLRSLFWASGGSNGSWQEWPGMTEFMGGLPHTGTKPAPKGHNISSVPFASNILGKPMKIILSPYIKYTDSGTDTTDILIADSSALGLLVVDSLPTTRQFDDPLRQIRSFAITERYALAPHFSGNGIAKIESINVLPGYDPDSFTFTKTLG